MTQNRILSLLVSAALLCGLLAGCSNTNGDASHASSSASEPSSVSSESAPSSTAQADTSCPTAPGESAGPITGRDGAESRPAYALRCIPACPPGL